MMGTNSIVNRDLGDLTVFPDEILGIFLGEVPVETVVWSCACVCRSMRRLVVESKVITERVVEKAKEREEELDFVGAKKLYELLRAWGKDEGEECLKTINVRMSGAINSMGSREGLRNGRYMNFLYQVRNLKWNVEVKKKMISYAADVAVSGLSNDEEKKKAMAVLRHFLCDGSVEVRKQLLGRVTSSFNKRSGLGWNPEGGQIRRRMIRMVERVVRELDLRNCPGICCGLIDMASTVIGTYGLNCDDRNPADGDRVSLVKRGFAWLQRMERESNDEVVREYAQNKRMECGGSVGEVFEEYHILKEELEGRKFIRRRDEGDVGDENQAPEWKKLRVYVADEKKAPQQKRKVLGDVANLVG